jgi:hypothetical protein
METASRKPAREVTIKSLASMGQFLLDDGRARTVMHTPVQTTQFVPER